MYFCTNVFQKIGLDLNHLSLSALITLVAFTKPQLALRSLSLPTLSNCDAVDGINICAKMWRNSPPGTLSFCLLQVFEFINAYKRESTLKKTDCVVCALIISVFIDHQR